MKRLLKHVSVLALVLVCGAGAGAAYVQVRGIPSYPVEKIDLKVEVTPERVEHGRRLAGMLCLTCHLDPSTGVVSGRRMPDVPPEFGTVYSRNITRDPAHGIGSWTDGELAFLLRTGIRRNGKYTPPYMVKLPHASDEDIAALIAFIRSDDPQVGSAQVASRESDITFLTKVLTYVAFKPFAYPKQPIAAPPAADKVAYGKYLADRLLDCYACHSADFKTNDYFEPPRSKGFYAGSNLMLDASGRKIYTANITPDPQTGIGGWSEEQFVRALKGGFRPDNSPILYPMQTYNELSDDEARAVYAYLRSVPPIAKARPAAEAHQLPAATSAGQEVYDKYRCSSCHGQAGLGLCDMRQTAKKYPTDADLAGFIKSPARTTPGSKMPAWEGVIQEDEYAPLVAYVRSLQTPAAQ